MQYPRGIPWRPPCSSRHPCLGRSSRVHNTLWCSNPGDVDFLLQVASEDGGSRGKGEKREEEDDEDEEEEGQEEKQDGEAGDDEEGKQDEEQVGDRVFCRSVLSMGRVCLVML